MNINVSVTDANNIVCQVTPTPQEVVTIDRGVAGVGISSITPVTISTLQYLRITYTNGVVQDVGPLTSTAYFGQTPILITGNTISLTTVPVNLGGTGQTTANAAFNALAPSQTGNSGKFLTTDGTNTSWSINPLGTVTSVNASGGTTGLSFSGGPITTSGTLTLAGILAVANGGTGVTASSGANSVVLRDGNQNIFANNFIPNTTITTASSTPINLTVASAQYQIVNGTITSQQFNLPDATTLTIGETYYFNNNLTYSSVQVNAHDGSTSILALQAGGAAHVVLLSNSTTNGTWDVHYYVPASVSWGNATLSFNSASSISGSVSWQGNAVGIAYGGTGQTTANAAFNALAPSQTGNSGKYLTTDGTNTSWAVNPLGTVTSVAATVPAFLSVSGSPITSSGTLAISLSGTALPVANGGTGLTSYTANGVVYASASGTLATGSALTFDGTTLTGTVSGALAANFNRTTSSGPTLKIQVVGTDVGTLGSDTGGNGIFDIAGGNINLRATGTSSVIAFSANNAEQMRLTSTGLGIGTSSPSNKLHVSGTGSTSALFQRTGSNGSFIGLRDASGSDAYLGVTNGVFSIQTAGSGYSDKLTIDTSGNLGLGVTPSAWQSTRRALQIGTNAALWGQASGSGATFLSNNIYFDGTAFKYLTTSAASYYVQLADGSHTWNTAASGSAGASASFTQAMTLDANGNLLVGTTSVLTAGKLSVGFNGTSNNGIVFNDTVPAAGVNYALFQSAGTTIGSIVRVAATSAVIYNTTSDYRLKEVIGAVSGSGERIDALQPIDYTMKADGSQHRGFLAHQFQEVYANSVSGVKDAVDSYGKPIYQQMQAGTAEVIADLVAEIQSLRARLKAANIA